MSKFYLWLQPSHQEVLLLLSPDSQWSLHHSLQTCINIHSNVFSKRRKLRILCFIQWSFFAKTVMNKCITWAARTLCDILLTWFPHQCRSPQCCWWLLSSLRCCCHPVGSPPPLSDSQPPSHRQTAPEQHSVITPRSLWCGKDILISSRVTSPMLIMQQAFHNLCSSDVASNYIIFRSGNITTDQVVCGQRASFVKPTLYSV